MSERLKKFAKKYNHIWILSYGFLYLIWFTYLEKNVTTEYTPMYCKLDDYIPFNEIFVIPYCLWFFYVAIFVAIFFFLDKKEYYRFCSFLFVVMSICLLICTLFPNGQDLRPTTFARDNALVDMVKSFYTTDTSTNVFPSIHCFNSIVIAIAVYKSTHLRKLKHYKALLIGCILLSLSIMLSTVFIKQHSILDMFGALALSACMYPFIYTNIFSKNKQTNLDEVPTKTNINNDQPVEEI
ncbi:MAG: phosphatase PAP2 family protein [Clostridia bacterium]|nr:phosphatase PAP2 family protein [Clostridia bacterium]